MSARIFIRNDDVWTLDRPFQFFFDSAIEHRVPVIYAVIPRKMDQGLVRFLRKAKEATPDLLDIVQHGWMHTNHSKDKGHKYEFGISRSVEIQREDIRQGYTKMCQAFGDLWIRAFVPPYHGYNGHTMQILDDEGFKFFSAGQQRLKPKTMANFSTQISFSQYQSNQTSIKKADEVLVDLIKHISKQSFSGVLTHHADFKTAAARCELLRFFDLIKSGSDKKKWKLYLFSDFKSQRNL